MSQSKKQIAINSFLIVVAMIASYSAARMVRNSIVTRTQSEEMTKKIEELKAKKVELEAQLQEIQTKSAVEREAKERLNMKNPGEEVVVVVPEKKDATGQEAPQSLWTKFKSMFVK